MSFGSKIRELREALGWSQGQLYLETRWNSQSISDVERGRRPPPDPDTARAAAVALGAEPVELMAMAAVERGTIDRPSWVSDEQWHAVVEHAVAALEAAHPGDDS